MTTKSDYSQKLLDPRWQRVKSRIQHRDDFTCRDCGARDKTLHVHHCYYAKGDPWDTPDKFLLTLCWECHEDRQSLEDDGKKALGMIFSKIIQDGNTDLYTFVSSLVQQASSDDTDPCMSNSNEIEWIGDLRWYNAACNNPKFRKCYEFVTGSKIKWSIIDKAKK